MLKKFIFCCFLILVSTIPIFPQIAYDESVTFNSKILLLDTTINNTLSFEEENKTYTTQLLPERISFMEKFLWGKNGAFRKIGLAGDLNIENREKEIKLRRTLLTIHQTLGILTWFSMAATVTAGQLWLDGKLDSPSLHRTLKYPTIIGYSLTGLFSVISPPPIERRKEFSTISIHKTLAWLHFAGMVATPILGRLILSSNDYYKSARFHQIVGYSTFTVFSISLLTILLFK